MKKGVAYLREYMYNYAKIHLNLFVKNVLVSVFTGNNKLPEITKNKHNPGAVK